MGILDDWIEDLPQQFQGKKNIEILLKAFSRQVEDLYKVYEELDNMTDLDTAEGANLDNVGEIVTLTRKEAGVLAGIDVEDPVISDERYRQFLKYQMLVNTNECTYKDLMDGLALLWNISPIYYREDKDLPAVIILTMPFLTPGGKVVTLGEVPMVKPAGVRIEFEYYIKAIIEIAYGCLIQEYDVPRCNTIVCGTYPRISTIGNIIEIRCEHDVNTLIAAFENSKTGTIRIGGKVFDSTLGNTFTEDIEIEINKDLQIVDFIQSGQSVAGINPDTATAGVIIPKDLIVSGSSYTQKYSTPASGRLTSGGGELADSLSVSVTGDIETENALSIGTTTQISASPTEKCGGDYKTVSVVREDTEAVVNVYIAAATVKKCGTTTCGNKE